MPRCDLCLSVSLSVGHNCVKGKGSPYSITERRVPELIPVLGSQPACDMSHKHGGRLPLLSARPAVTLATLTRATTTASWLRFEPGPFCAWVQHANQSATIANMIERSVHGVGAALCQITLTTCLATVLTTCRRLFYSAPQFTQSFPVAPLPHH